MKRFLLAFVGMAAISFSTGCCGWWWPHWGVYGPGGYGAPGGCPGGACGVTPGQGGIPPSSYYQGPGSVQSVQMGVPQPIQGPVTMVPGAYPAGPVVRTAAMPLESLPTY